MLNGEERGRRSLGLMKKRSQLFTECVAMPSVKGQELDKRRLNKLGDTVMLLICSREMPNSNLCFSCCPGGLLKMLGWYINLGHEHFTSVPPETCNIEISTLKEKVLYVSRLYITQNIFSLAMTY